MSDTLLQSTPLHGPGGLLATPGLGTRRKRNWGLRLKAKQIAGNLYRGDNGKFQAGSGGSPAGATPQRGRQLSKQPKPTAKPAPKPVKAAPKRRGGGKGRAAAKPKPTPEQRQAERDTANAAKQTANRTAVSDALANADASLGPTGVKAVLAAADGGPIDGAMGAQLQTLGYAQQNPDGSYRLTSEARALASAANRGDTRAALDADGRAQERAKKATDAAAKKPAAEPAKPKQPAGPKGALDAIANTLAKPAKPAKPAAAGGGGGKKPAEKPDKAAERARRATETASQVGMSAPDLAALRSATETGGVQNAALAQLGLVGTDGLATDQGRRALTALERGDVRQYNAALQDAKARMGREQAATDRRSAAAQLRDKKRSQQIERIKRRAMSGGKLTQSQMDQAIEAGALGLDGRWKSFTVFKDHQGQPRWIARTTTAYRDRDKEILSEAALDTDSQRMMATKQFGPLRYWHVGQPDPFDDRAPWGPGLDIGDCDYSVLIGRTRIESGTFRDPVIAQKIARQADRYELSPGFFHPLDEPDADGVFSAIRTFERSIVPTRHGRASNLFTGLAVKEHRMDINEMERRFKTMYADLGLTPEQGAEIGQQLVATEKTAAAQGIAFKSEAEAPEAPDLVINGVTYKAMPKALADVVEAAPADEEKAADPIDVVEESVDDETGMDDGQLVEAIAGRTADMLMERLTPLFGDMKLSEFKTLLSGVAQKDDSRAQELAALKSQQTELAQKIAQIEGNQPATILPDEVSAALKSAGPAQPEAAQPQKVESTPERPFAALAAATFPELYYGENGWQPQQGAS